MDVERACEQQRRSDTPDHFFADFQGLIFLLFDLLLVLCTEGPRAPATSFAGRMY